MKKLLLLILTIGCVLVGLFVIFILIMAAFSKPPASIKEVLAQLPAEERQALEDLCRAAGVNPLALHPIYGWSDDTISHELNRLSIGLKDGRIHSIRLAEQNLTALPDLSALGELECLWFDGNKLSGAALRTLSKLHTLNLSRNHIAALTGAGWQFPASLRRLLIADNEIADLGPLATLSALTELQLANNKVTSISPLATLRSLKLLNAASNQVSAFDALVPLSLERLDLRDNRVAAFPDALPQPPNWKVNLDRNPLLNPPGFIRHRTYRIAYSGTGGGRLTQKGTLRGSGPFDVSGTWEHLPALRIVELSTALESSSSLIRATLEASVKKGRVRFFLLAPDDFWNRPWIKKGLVEGYSGTFRVLDDWVYADADPQHPVRLVGNLQAGTGQDPAYQFQMEPLDGPAEEIKYRIYRE